ncbi:hypothetical protein [Streptomyces zagrosensis]|uniref:Uncharacterized protein n=1 Tax=Streptomyces zagrosensis TaxID=1042984 RepID=A0A7W9QJD5_9ACTN|nr:hypothetical protein [Streptomyces zagrosensis]MBB5940087.1 hypothetical protein [Streptomyces zagrosensis]
MTVRSEAAHTPEQRNEGQGQPASSDGTAAPQPLRKANVRREVDELVRASIPEGLLMASRSEIEAIQARAYAQGWRDSVAHRAESSAREREESRLPPFHGLHDQFTPVTHDYAEKSEEAASGAKVIRFLHSRQRRGHPYTA